MIKLIAAVDNNNVIGSQGTIPWHIPEDFQFFKEQTDGHVVVMGRKTWESLPKKPLPNRLNIVITRDPFYEPDGAFVARNVTDAFNIYLNRHIYRTDGKREGDLYVMGGQSIYEAFLPFADEVLLTEIDIEVKEGDTYFPSLGDEWYKVSRRRGIKQHETGYRYQFVSYKRKNLNCEEGSNGKAKIIFPNNI